MGKSIVDIQNMGDALRNTGYKNIESAVSEIIDNSIEAEAKNVFIIISEGIDRKSGWKVVDEIGFLDNGTGMDFDTLGSCLGIGATTRQARKGMGRFGVGLPQASLYACPNVVVYSWQNSIENCKKVFLDINMVKDGTQTELEDPQECPLPDKYLGYIKYKTQEKEYDFSQSGTLVVWKKCDRIQPKTSGALIPRLEFALGQKFRYFISRGISNLRIINDNNQDNSFDICPNDPLFLMENNYVLGDSDYPGKLIKTMDFNKYEPVFEPYTGDGVSDGTEIVPVKYYDKDGNIAESTVTIRFSIVKAKFYDETAFPKGKNPGNSPFGKYAAKLEGISVVRANREIDFRKFDFYDNINEPQHRWWGCEIEFGPELDEVFGVANNKQYVELKKIEEEDIDYNEEIQPIWLKLDEIIRPTIKAMYNKNEETRKNTRSFDDTISVSTDIINVVESDDENDIDESIVDGEIAATEEVPTLEEIVEAGRQELESQGYEDTTDEQAVQFINNKVNFVYMDLGERSPAFDYKFVLSTTKITINTSHRFYTNFLSKVYENDEAKVTFELLLASLIQSIRKLDGYQKVENDRLVTLWYEKLNKFIQEQFEPRDAK